MFKITLVFLVLLNIAFSINTTFASSNLCIVKYKAGERTFNFGTGCVTSVQFIENDNILQVQKLNNISKSYFNFNTGEEVLDYVPSITPPVLVPPAPVPVSVVNTTVTACPALPANSELFDTIDSSGRGLTIMELPTGYTRYIKLVPGPDWEDESRYTLGKEYVDHIIPRITAGWTGEWGISRCPGDLTSSNVVQKSKYDIFMFWYGLTAGASPLLSTQNGGASGLPGLLLPENQGGQAWYINFRTDDCDPNAICKAAYQVF